MEPEEQLREQREQERMLPVANLSRIMKRALPDEAKVSRDAKEMIQSCVSEFIGFLTSEAAEILTLDNRKTITGSDLIGAMKSLGFDAYVDPLQVYLQSYRIVS
jgi:nuclear transcription Y subunit beta